jgi:hypothetical protein
MQRWGLIPFFGRKKSDPYLTMGCASLDSLPKPIKGKEL